MHNVELLCKMQGGSYSYGLATPTSDVDWRGVFVNTDIATVIGLDKHEHQQKQDDATDEVYTEFRNALKLLKNGNTQMIELLYSENFALSSHEWRRVQHYRKDLISSEKLFSCLRGYMQSELRLANGERTGQLGSKRKAALDQFGFSPKNMVQLFRLGWAGRIYFQKGHFPVDVAKEDKVFRNFLFEVKTNPAKFTKEWLNDYARELGEKLVFDFENRKYSTFFNEDLAHRLCLEVYGPIINELQNSTPLWT